MKNAKNARILRYICLKNTFSLSFGGNSRLQRWGTWYLYMYLSTFFEYLYLYLYLQPKYLDLYLYLGVMHLFPLKIF